MERLDTLPKILVRNHGEYGARTAMRQKMLGIWREYSWRDYYENVKDFSLGLASLGLGRNGKVAIIGDNAPEWYWAEIAAVAAGGVVVGIPTEATPPEIEYFVNHSEADFVVASSREQVERILKIKDHFPGLRKVICWESRGLQGQADPSLTTFDAVKELGRSCEESRPGLFLENIEKGEGSDLALLCYASGSAGELPKAAMFSYNNIISVAPGSRDYRPLSQNDNYVSYMSPAIFLEQQMGIAGGMITPFVVNFPEEPATTQDDIREIGPAMLVYPPQTLRDIAFMVQTRMRGGGFPKRFAYSSLLPIGYKTLDSRLNGDGLNWFWRALHALASVILFRPLKDKLGMTRAGILPTEGGLPGPEVFRFFHAIGINIAQSYSVPECPVCTAQMPADVRADTVGQPVLGHEVTISPRGEILVRGPSLFQGYYKDTEATSLRLRDGWFHTGDMGVIDEKGQLIPMGRMSDHRNPGNMTD